MYLTLGNFKTLKITNLASNCRHPNEYDRADLCRPWNESQWPVTATSYSLSRYDQQSSMLQVICWSFNKTTLHLIVPRTPLNCYSKKRQTSLALMISDHQTAQTWIQQIIRSGVFCSRECMNVVWTVSISWSSTSLNSGTVFSRTLLMRPSMNGESDRQRACVQMDNILNIHCQHMWLTKVMDK